MSTPARVIIDTDPGIDDVLAMLLAFSASPQELEVLMISITFGNIDVRSCLRNVISIFHIIAKERSWRREHGHAPGFEALAATKPIVAVGADQPLAEQIIMADYFHGMDGLGDIHASHPHLSPDDAWKTLFDLPEDPGQPSQSVASQELSEALIHHDFFIPSKIPAHKEILRLLRHNEPGSITIIAIGPLTNLALAASEDPVTFLRVKEVVVMGGAISVHGNITPLAEFNTHADTVAFARVLALTSPVPKSTMPPTPPGVKHLPDYPKNLPSRLNMTLFPLDITTPHLLMPSAFAAATQALDEAKSPLAAWSKAFMAYAFRKCCEFGSEGLSLHDPLTVWYAMRGSSAASLWKLDTNCDVRVETAGQWTRGACVVDRRPLQRTAGEVHGDYCGWLSSDKGNRVNICVSTPGEKLFERELLRYIFGVDV